MQTYKTFLKIVKKNLPSLMIYFVIFMVISIIGTSQNSSAEEELYKDEEIKFTLFNRDGSKLGDSIKEYLSGKNKFVETEDSEEAIREALYYRSIYYAVIIPEGFEEAILKGEDMELWNYKVSDSAMGYYMDMAVEEYVKTLKSYLAAGNSMDESIAKTEETLETTVSVSLADNMETEKNPMSLDALSEKPSYYYFYQYIPYIFLASVITCLGPILLSFGKRDVKMRINVSAETFKSHAFQMFLGVVTFGIAVLVVFNALGMILYGEIISVSEAVCYFILSFCFLMICLGISYMAGCLFDKTSTLGGFANVISLGLSFLGGVFVPIQLLGDGMLNVARFTPTYWYIMTNDVIIGAKSFGDLDVREFAINCGILLLYALAFFCIGLAILKHKKEEA